MTAPSGDHPAQSAHLRPRMVAAALLGVAVAVAVIVRRADRTDRHLRLGASTRPAPDTTARVVVL